MSVELECPGLKGSLESGDKLAAEDTAEHFDGKEERAAGGDPAAVLWSEAAGGQHDVDIVGGQQFLFPCLEPAHTGVALTLWAMPVSARVVRDGRMSAV